MWLLLASPCGTLAEADGDAGTAAVIAASGHMVVTRFWPGCWLMARTTSHRPDLSTGGSAAEARQLNRAIELAKTIALKRPECKAFI